MFLHRFNSEFVVYILPRNDLLDSISIYEGLGEIRQEIFLAALFLITISYTVIV